MVFYFMNIKKSLIKKIIFCFFIYLIIFLPKNIFSAESINGLKICANQPVLDTRFQPYLNNSRLIQNCNQENLPVYSYDKCNTQNNNPIAVKIDRMDDGEGVDLVFDTIFDKCINPRIIIIDTQSQDSYFTGLLSVSIFFYVKGTKYIDVGDINLLDEFRKKLLLAVLNFISNSPSISYPTLHPNNGDPWKKKFGERPKAMGIIGNNFAMFTNLTYNDNINFEEENLLPLDTFSLFSNLKPSTALTATYLSLAPKEAIFITNITIPSLPIIPTYTPFPNLSPTSSSSTITSSPVTKSPTPTLFSPRILTITPKPTSSTNLAFQVITDFFQKEKEEIFNFYTYIIFSFLYISLVHFAVNFGSEFNLMILVGIFVLAGILGYLMLGFEAAFVLGVVLSLIFISGPRKDL